MINKEIIGYELVKDVKKIYGCEFTESDKLFVIRKSNDDDYLSNLCEVRESTHDNYLALEKKYPFSEYFIWHGTINVGLDDSGDVIELYWG